MTAAGAAYASAAWPGLLIPLVRKSVRLSAESANDIDADVRFDQDPATREDPTTQWFVLMDGGLTGTLGSRLDPVLHGTEGTSVMGTIHQGHDERATNVRFHAGTGRLGLFGE